MAKPMPRFDNSELIHLLDIVNQRLRHNHDTLWKEEIHYTWLSYILVGGLIYVFVISRQVSLDLLTAIGFFLLALSLSIIGILVCIWGFKAVRREGIYFHIALEIRNRLHRALGLHKYLVENETIFPDVDPYDELKPPKDWKAVEEDANKCLGQLFSLKKKHNIRDFFQLTMLLPMFIFFAALLYSVVSFVLYLVN